MFEVLLIAGGLSLDVERLSVDGGEATAIVKVTNSGSEGYRVIFVDCAFLDAQKAAVGVGKAMLSNVSPGEAAYDDVKIFDVPGVESVRCRISQTSP